LLTCFLAANIQNLRSSAYAQDPLYNVVDTVFLRRLQIMRTDSPRGFSFVDSSSFTYPPGAEDDVALNILSRDPALSLQNSECMIQEDSRYWQRIGDDHRQKICLVVDPFWRLMILASF
jgi:hypothetical protein